jgi:hypothetical protein
MNDQIAIVVNSDFHNSHPVLFTVGESYNFIADAVGGMISCVTLDNGLEMWVNDEYLYNGDEFSPVATAAYWKTYGAFSHYVNGAVVFTGGADYEGNTIGLNFDQLSFVGSLLLDFGHDLDLTPLMSSFAN